MVEGTSIVAIGRRIWILMSITWTVGALWTVPIETGWHSTPQIDWPLVTPDGTPGTGKFIQAELNQDPRFIPGEAPPVLPPDFFERQPQIRKIVISTTAELGQLVKSTGKQYGWYSPELLGGLLKITNPDRYFGIKHSAPLKSIAFAYSRKLSWALAPWVVCPFLILIGRWVLTGRWRQS